MEGGVKIEKFGGIATLILAQAGIITLIFSMIFFMWAITSGLNKEENAKKIRRRAVELLIFGSIMTAIASMILWK